LGATIFRYLTILVAQEGLHLHVINDITTYLYDSLDKDIYMKIPEGFNLANKANSKEVCSIKLKKYFLLIKTIRAYVV